MSTPARFGLLLLLVLVCVACGGEERAEPDPDLLTFRLEKSNEQELLRYFFGGYLQPAADPFDAGWIVEEGGRFRLRLDSLARLHPELAAKLKQDAGQTISWEELESFLGSSYYAVRRLPHDLETLTGQYGSWEGEEWYRVDVDGVMTTARRRLYIRTSALRHALGHYQENGEQLLYPDSTIAIGEHWSEGERRETTIMLKRPDGLWDFATYGPEGTLAAETSTPPRSLSTPTQCAGCHLGTRLFEPEESFPAEAAAGPHGPRALHVGPELRDAEVVRHFQEHAKRSDMLLGLYNTLFVSALRNQRDAGSLGPDDRQLLESLGL